LVRSDQRVCPAHKNIEDEVISLLDWTLAIEAGGAILGGAADAGLARRRDWELARTLLLSYGLDVIPVTSDDAEHAACRWRTGGILSLGDRLCLALGERLDATVWTADKAWGRIWRIRQIR
jgi:hypothetical protein